MNTMEFIDILLFGVVAGVILFRLWTVLGTRTGHEAPPPETARRAPNAPAPAADQPPVIAPRPLPNYPAAAARGLADIAGADRNFDPETFLGGASAAYEMIVSAFAAGDRDTLKPLLSREVFDGFSGVLAAREARGEKIEFTFVGIDRADIVDAGIENGMEQVTVRFSSQLISVTRGRDGAVVEGDPQKVAEVTDVWTFAREVRSSDPNWKLVATDAGD